MTNVHIQAVSVYVLSQEETADDVCLYICIKVLLHWSCDSRCEEELSRLTICVQPNKSWSYHFECTDTCSHSLLHPSSTHTLK